MLIKGGGGYKSDYRRAEGLSLIILLNYLKFTKFIKSLYNSFALVREVSFEAPQTSSFEVESCLIFMK